MVKINLTPEAFPEKEGVVEGNHVREIEVAIQVDVTLR